MFVNDAGTVEVAAADVVVVNFLQQRIHVLSTVVAAFPVRAMDQKISLSVNSVPRIVCLLELVSAANIKNYKQMLFISFFPFRFVCFIRIVEKKSPNHFL